MLRKKSNQLLLVIVLLTILTFIQFITNRNYFILYNIIIIIYIIYSVYSSRRIYIIDLWFAGFVYIIGGEYILINNEPFFIYNNNLFFAVQLVIMFGFIASLLGYVITNYSLNKRLFEGKISDLRPNRRTLRYIRYVFIAQFTVVLILYLRIGLTVFLTNTRSGAIFQVKDAQALMISFMYSLLIVFPISSVYLYSLKHSVGTRLLGMIGSLCSVGYILATGTRYYIGYLIGAIVFIYLGRFEKIKRKQIIIIIAVVVVVILINFFMRQYRMIGMENVEVKETFELFDWKQIFSNEGIFHMDMLIIDNINSNIDLQLGKENAFILYFWVPRFIWPNKPTMTGYWVVRELDPGNYSTGHSASGGFLFAALVDFGVIGGVLFCLIYGLLLSVIEKFYLKYRFTRYNPLIIYISLIIFTVFFMIRSLQTALISLIIYYIIGILPYYFIFKRFNK